MAKRKRKVGIKLTMKPVPPDWAETNPADVERGVVVIHMHGTLTSNSAFKVVRAIEKVLKYEEGLNAQEKREKRDGTA